LEDAEITVYDLRSDFDYLQARFTVASFFTRKLHYMIFFNPEAIRRHVPDDGLRAIVAHELAHINFYESQSRMGLVSLVDLLWP
jgi:predicted SprT family Zn-dependent metalloprotease